MEDPSSDRIKCKYDRIPQHFAIPGIHYTYDKVVKTNIILFDDETDELIPEYAKKLMEIENRDGFEKGIYTKMKINLKENILNGMIEIDDTILKIKHKLMYYLNAQQKEASERRELQMTDIHLWGMFEKINDDDEMVEQKVVLGYEQTRDGKKSTIPIMNPFKLHTDEIEKFDDIYNYNFIDSRTRRLRETSKLEFIDRHFTILDDYIRKYGMLKQLSFVLFPEFEQYCEDLSLEGKSLLKNTLYFNKLKYWVLNGYLNDSIVETLYNLERYKLDQTINYETFSTYIVNDMAKYIYKNDLQMKTQGCNVSDIEITYIPEYIDDGLINLSFVFKYFELNEDIPYMRMKLKDVKDMPHKIHKEVRKFGYSESLVKSWFASTYSYKMANGKRNQYLSIKSDAITFKINIPFINVTSEGKQTSINVLHTVYLHSSGEVTMRLIWPIDIYVTLDVVNNTIERINEMIIIKLNVISFHSAGKDRGIMLDLLPPTEINDTDKYKINSIITMMQFNSNVKQYLDSITYQRHVFNVICYTSQLFSSYVYTTSKCGSFAEGRFTGDVLQDVVFRYKKISEYNGKTAIEGMLINIVKDYDKLNALKMITERLNIMSTDANVIYNAIKETLDEETKSSKMTDSGSIEITVNSNGILIYGVHGLEELRRINMFMDVLFTYVFPKENIKEKTEKDKKFLNAVLKRYKGITVEYSMSNDILKTIQGINRRTRTFTDETLKIFGDIVQEYNVQPKEQSKIDERISKILEKQRIFNEEIKEEENAQEELSDMGSPSTELGESEGSRTTVESVKRITNTREVVCRSTLSKLKSLQRLKIVDPNRFKSGGPCTTKKQQSISTAMPSAKRPAILSENSFIELLTRLRIQQLNDNPEIAQSAKQKLQVLHQGMPLRKIISDGEESEDMFYYYFCPYAYCYVCNELFLKSKIGAGPKIRADNSQFLCPNTEKNSAGHRGNIMHVTYDQRTANEFPYFAYKVGGCNCLVKSSTVLLEKEMKLKRELFGEVEVWKEHVKRSVDSSDYILLGNTKLIGERYGFLPIALNDVFNQGRIEGTERKPQFYIGWFLRMGSENVTVKSDKNLNNYNSFINVIGKTMKPSISNESMRKYIIDKVKSNSELFYSARQGELVTIFAHEDKDDIVDFTDMKNIRDKSLRNFIAFMETNEFVDEHILWDLVANKGFIHKDKYTIPIIFEATNDTVDVCCPIGQNAYIQDSDMLKNAYIVFIMKMGNDYDIIYYNGETDAFLHHYVDIFEKDDQYDQFLQSATGKETKEERRNLDILRYYKTVNTIITDVVIPKYEECAKYIDDRPFKYYRELNKIQKYDFSQIQNIDDIYDSPQFTDKRMLLELKSNVNQMQVELPTYDLVKSRIENTSNVPYDYGIKCVIIDDQQEVMFVVLNNNFKIPVIKEQIDLTTVNVLSYRFIELLTYDKVLEYSKYIQTELDINLGIWQLENDVLINTVSEIYDDMKEHVISLMTFYGTVIEIYPMPLIQKYLGKLSTTLIIKKLLYAVNTTKKLNDGFIPIGQVINHYNRVNYILLKNDFRMPINNGNPVDIAYKLDTININDITSNPYNWIDSYRILVQITQLISEYGRIYGMLIHEENAVGIKMENSTILMTQPTLIRTIDIDEIGVLKIENLRFDIDEVNGVISIGNEVQDLRNQLVNFRGFTSETYQRLRFEFSKLLSTDEFKDFREWLINVANSNNPIDQKRQLILDTLVKHSILSGIITDTRTNKIDLLNYEPEKTRIACFMKETDICENDPHCGKCSDGTCKVYIPSDDDETLKDVPDEYRVYVSGGFNKYVHLLIDELAQKRFLGNEIYYDQVSVVPEHEFDIIRDTEIVIDEIDKKHTELQRLFEQFSYTKLNQETYRTISDPTYVKMEEFVSYESDKDVKRANTQLPAHWAGLKESMNLLRYTGNMLDMLVTGFNEVMLREEKFNVVELKNNISKYASLFVQNDILDDIYTESAYINKLNDRNYKIGEVELAILAKSYNICFIILDKNKKVQFSSNLYNRKYSEPVMDVIKQIKPLEVATQYKSQLSYVLLMSSCLIEHDFNYIFSHMINTDTYMFNFIPQLLKKYVKNFVSIIKRTVHLEESQMPLLYASSSFLASDDSSKEAES